MCMCMCVCVYVCPCVFACIRICSHVFMLTSFHFTAMNLSSFFIFYYAGAPTLYHFTTDIHHFVNFTYL